MNVSSEGSTTKSFRRSQTGQMLVHPRLPQPTSKPSPDQKECRDHSHVLEPAHTFVVAADTQFGMLDRNRPPKGDWECLSEVEYSRRAIECINNLSPRPLFCCVCGDLVDMTSNVYAGLKKDDDTQDQWTTRECDDIQNAQNAVFQKTWVDLHPDIPLVCVCGNHDVGDRPTAASIERFQKAFGDDRLAFWANGSYNIVLNTSLVSDPESAPDLDKKQWKWLQDRLKYARESCARIIFVFGHHPWFLYDENEDEGTLPGTITWPGDTWGPKPESFQGFPDSYFPIPRERRRRFLELFERYQVTACFAGHFHQNLVTKTSFGMGMITTGPLSVVLQSTHNMTKEPFVRGFRVVRVDAAQGSFTHEYVPLE